MAERVHLLSGHRSGVIAYVPDEGRIAEFPSRGNTWRRYLRTEDRDPTSGLRIYLSIGERKGPHTACPTCVDRDDFLLHLDRLAIELATDQIRRSALMQCVDCRRLYEVFPEGRTAPTELDLDRARHLYRGAL